MAYSPLTAEGEKFIRKVCEGNGNSLLQGKHSYALPYTTPPATQTWVCSIKDPADPTKIISSNSQLGEALIYWFNKYAGDFLLDANVIAAQAFAESGYIAWNYAGGDSTASGINQFTMITIFAVITENLGSPVLSNSTTSMSNTDIAALIYNLRNPQSRDSYNVKSTLPQDAFFNRPLLHQNVINNPGIMIKAQCYYMKFFANNSDSLASTALFCYSRGRFMSPTYSRAIQKCDTNFPSNLDYKKEGLAYVLKIFGILGDKDNALRSKGLDKGYKPVGYYFGYDQTKDPKEPNKNLKLTDDWNPYNANVSESSEFNLQNDITANNQDLVVVELSKYPKYKFIYYPENLYQHKETDKWQIVLHHTASGGVSSNANGAANDILFWEQQVAKTGTKVATSFILTRDGTILQLFSTRYWAYHLGITDAWFTQYGTPGIDNVQLNSQSVGIEIDNWGGLINVGGSWYPAANPKGAAIPIQNVIEYKAPNYPHGFHGYFAFEKYTPDQIASLRVLIHAINVGFPKIQLKYENDLLPGVNMWGTYDNGSGKWLAEKAAYAENKGVWTHVSYNPEKSDCQPQPELVDMLRTL